MRLATTIRVFSTKIENGLRKIKYLRYGKQDVQTSSQVLPFGFDSSPPKDTRAVQIPTSENGKAQVIGYLIKDPVASDGESRMFAVDSSGNVMGFLHLKSDGIAEFMGVGDFLARFNELKTGFDELRDDVNNHIAEYKVHTHPGVTSGGSATGPTVSTLTPSTASIDNAKIEEIKTTPHS